MPRGTKQGKEIKRRVVAAGKITDRPIREIAKAAGCSERHVERLASEAETELVARDLLKPHEKRLKRSPVLALNAIDRGLQAKLKTPHDHRAQLAAAGRLHEYLELLKVDARDLAGSDGDGPMVTWEEFVVMYRRRMEAMPNDNAGNATVEV